MIRILFFVDTTLASGGAERVLRNLVNNMDQSQFDITVQTVWPEDARKYLVPGIRYRSVYGAKHRMNRLLFRLETQLGLLYRRHLADDYDIEVAYLECGPTKILASSTNPKAKKLAWVHCDLMRMTDDPEAFVRKSKKWYKKFDKVICVSESVQETYQSLFGTGMDTLVLYNTVDDAEILQKARDSSVQLPEQPRCTIATIGRMYRQKGYDRLVDAAHRLAKDGYVFDLWILGEGPEWDALAQQVAEYGLEDTVHFLGFQKNPYPFMKAADIIVCSSYYEGFSTVVTESLILGRPVVTTPCSGMRELLGSSEYGIITEDSTDGIYEGLKKMLDDPALRERYAEAAAVRGRAFSKEKLVGETEAFFRGLLNERGIS